MTQRPLWITAGLSLALLATFAAARTGNQTSQGPEIRDKSGSTWVRGWSKVRYEKLADGRLKYIVRAATGKKIMGSWKKEGMDVEVGELDFIVTPVGGTFELQTAAMGGGIKANFNRPSANADSKATQTATINASSADYSGATNVVDVKGQVVLTRDDPGISQSLKASGSSGVITLSKPGAKGNIVQKATLNGPISMTLEGTRKGDDGKAQKYDVKGSADKMVFDEASNTVTFLGHVKVTGDDPSLGGQISGVSKVVITFAKTGEVESIDMEGDPVGTTEIGGKKGGGGRR